MHCFLAAGLKRAPGWGTDLRSASHPLILNITISGGNAKLAQDQPWMAKLHPLFLLFPRTGCTCSRTMWRTSITWAWSSSETRWCATAASETTSDRPSWTWSHERGRAKWWTGIIIWPVYTQAPFDFFKSVQTPSFVEGITEMIWQVSSLEMTGSHAAESLCSSVQSCLSIDCLKGGGKDALWRNSNRATVSELKEAVFFPMKKPTTVIHDYFIVLFVELKKYLIVFELTQT